MRTATFVCVSAAFVSVVMLASCSTTVAPSATVAPTTTLTVAPITTTTVAPELYQIGDVGPAGGTVFITPSTVGNSTGLYFEVAPRASRRLITWAFVDNSELGVPGARGKAIGDGAANTAAIASQVGNVADSSAAVYASEYSLNGFSDWFLPSKDELNEMYEYRDSLGGFGLDYYWSSSEWADDFAWFRDFLNGGERYGFKRFSSHYVRPVRAFAFPTTVAPEAYRIGDVGPAGGTIFITPSTSGNTTGLYFEVAPPASEVRRTWATGDNYRLTVPGAGGTAIGDGAANTAAIASQVGNLAESSAAVYASEYSLNGVSDWFLPSRIELNELYKNRNLVGGFSTGYYWSSSEGGAGLAWGQDFRNGYQLNDFNLLITFYVRPVRAFP